MSQLLLIPDPRPLDQCLGANFFRQAPKRAGVYLMKDASNHLLYIGKAKNLQQRLGNYRIANPDKMPRRHLKMLRQVARIEFQFCPGESAALKHEAKLLRSLKPRFNRAGVWPGKTRFMVWRQAGQQLELSVNELPQTGWHRYGPLGGSSWSLYPALARLLWLAGNPNAAVTGLPSGWAQNRLAEMVVIPCGQSATACLSGLNSFFWEAPETFLLWLGAEFATRVHPFERKMIEADVEVLKAFAAKMQKINAARNQLALL